MEKGESIPQLRKRVMQVTGVSKARGTMIARTEVIGAQNRGSLNSMTAAGMPGEKSWLSTRDHLTRETHRNAHGQIRKLLVSQGDTHFTVGGVSMDGPHDPSAPPRETINCRCTLIYELDEQAATQAVEDGAWEELDEDAAVRRWMQNAPSTMKGYNDSTLRYLIQEEQRKGLVTYAKGDHTVKIMKPGPLVKAKVKRLFATVDELLRDAPPHPGRKVDILVGATGSTKRYRIFGTTALGSHEIVIDRGLLMKNQGPDYFSPVGFMPAARTTDPLVYTLTHEWGHALTPLDGISLTGNRAMRRVWRNNDFAFGKYGRSSVHEGYAEAFAEWYLTRGLTTNAAAKAYAREFGWRLPR